MDFLVATLEPTGIFNIGALPMLSGSFREAMTNHPRANR